MSEIKTTVVEHADSLEDDFKAPAKWFIKNALDQMVFIHTKNRAEAQAYVDSEYGKGFYTVKTLSTDKSGSGNCTAMGSPSRKCFHPRLKGLKG